MYCTVFLQELSSMYNIPTRTIQYVKYFYKGYNVQYVLYSYRKYIVCAVFPQGVYNMYSIPTRLIQYAQYSYRNGTVCAVFLLYYPIHAVFLRRLLSVDNISPSMTVHVCTVCSVQYSFMNSLRKKVFLHEL
jgi:hypothetical protein